MESLNNIELEEIQINQLDSLIDFTALHCVNPKRYPFILESSAQAEDILADKVHSAESHARYSILFCFPQETLTLYSDNQLEGAVVDSEKDFLSNLDSQWLNNKTAFKNTEFPFIGGWFVYLSYEFAAQIEPRLKLPMPEHKSVIARLTRIPAAIIHDKNTNKQFIVIENSHSEKFNKIFDDIEKISVEKFCHSDVNVEIKEELEDVYLNSIKKVKEYIKEGDVFQVNLSRLWKARDINGINTLCLYHALKKSNPAPFSAYVNYDECKIISSSPERLVKVKDGRVQTRPIAGTRARKNETKEDIENLKELIAHPKERAEHVMLIDLERNDLGRICKPGSIHVDELMVLESFKHVHHIVSNVAGSLRENITPGNIIHAVFPGGTITGCPKERCMQIIAELEAAPRGAYTGSVGYINRDGSMDLNILIRTFELSNNQLSLRAGAGLVADSVASKELDETRAKAKGLLKALH